MHLRSWPATTPCQWNWDTIDLYTNTWSAAIAAAASHFPGLPLAGYEHGEDLAPALASGFTAAGALRVWLR